MSDKYDAAIEFLVSATVEQLDASWDKPLIARGGCLFNLCCQDPENAVWQSSDRCGCLTEIRGDGLRSSDAALTQSIRGDRRIPECIELILDKWDRMNAEQRRALLTVFAEWQRAMDATIRQGKKWHPEFAPVPGIAKAGTEPRGANDSESADGVPHATVGEAAATTGEGVS